MTREGKGKPPFDSRRAILLRRVLLVNKKVRNQNKRSLLAANCQLVGEVHIYEQG